MSGKAWYTEFREYLQKLWLDIVIIELISRLGVLDTDLCSRILAQIVQWHTDGEKGHLVIIENDDKDPDFSVIFRTNQPMGRSGKQVPGKKLVIQLKKGYTLHYFTFEHFEGHKICYKDFVKDIYTGRQVMDKSFTWTFNSKSSNQSRSIYDTKVNWERQDDTGVHQTYVEEHVYGDSNKNTMYIKEDGKTTEYTSQHVHIKNYAPNDRGTTVLDGWEWIKSPDERNTKQITHWNKGVKTFERVYHKDCLTLHFERRMHPVGTPIGTVIYYDPYGIWYKAEHWYDDVFHDMQVVRYDRRYTETSEEQIREVIAIDERAILTKREIEKQLKEIDEQAKKAKNAILERKI